MNQLSTERKAFFDVMGNNALFTVHSDLTDGLIIEDILAPDGSSLLAALGFSVPAPYDEEGRAFIENNQVEMITPNAARCFQHKEAINIFYEGIGSAPYDIYIGSTDMYVRMNVRSVYLTCSAGIAIAKNGETDFDTLYRHADTALYVSKNNGKNRYYVYSEEMRLEDASVGSVELSPQ